MTKKIAFIFPGQGAQYVGMGKEFYDAYPAAREVFEEASDILSTDFAKLIFEGPADELMLTKNSQPAIFVVSVAILRVVLSQMPELKPTVCAGLSLGEYTALYASGRVSFAQALKLVAARGQAMQDACIETKGTMRVVLGMDEEAVRGALPDQVWIANLNCPGQVVIAGAVSAMPQAEEALKASGAKRVLPLDVSGAFHTPLMQSAQDRLKPLLMEAAFSESGVDFVMNVPGDYVRTLGEVRQFLIDQVAKATRWEKGVRAMGDIDLFVEIGPGRSLSGMNKKIGVAGRTVNVEKLADLEMVAKVAWPGKIEAFLSDFQSRPAGSYCADETYPNRVGEKAK